MADKWYLSAGVFFALFFVVGISGEAQTSLSPYPAALPGRVRTDLGFGVRDVEVRLYDRDGRNLLRLTRSNRDGQFAVPFLSAAGPVLVSPQKEGDFTNGVDAYDVYLLEQALASDFFGSAYQKIAADVNFDCRVTEADVRRLVDLLLSPETTEPVAKVWQFYDDACVPPLAAPFGACTNYKEFTDDSRADPIGFIAVKTGDLDNSAVLFANPSLSAGMGKALPIRVENHYFKKGDLRDIVLTWSPDVVCLQFQLQLAGLTVVDGFDDDRVRYLPTADGGRLRFLTTASGGSLRLRVRALRDGWLSNLLLPDWRDLVPVAYSEDGGIYHPDLHFRGGTGSEELIVSAVIAGEAGDIDISFLMRSASTWDCVLMDSRGRVVYRTSRYLPEGMHTVRLDDAGLIPGGVYSCRMSAGRQTVVRRIPVF